MARAANLAGWTSGRSAVAGPEVVHVSPEASWKEVMAVMRTHRVAEVSVMDAGGEILGVLSWTDLALPEDNGVHGDPPFFPGSRGGHERPLVRGDAERLMRPPPGHVRDRAERRPTRRE